MRNRTCTSMSLRKVTLTDPSFRPISESISSGNHVMQATAAIRAQRRSRRLPERWARRHNLKRAPPATSENSDGSSGTVCSITALAASGLDVTPSSLADLDAEGHCQNLQPGPDTPV